MVNEKRLIDPNDFLDLFYVASAGQDKAFIKAVEMVVEDTPTVDAVEVVHGRLVNVQGLGDGTCIGFCSNCRTPHKANNLTALRMDYRYCRWCGAKMDGGNEDGW